MEQKPTRRQRRDARRRRRAKQAEGFMRVFTLLAVLITGYLIFAMIDGAGAPKWTGSLEPNPFEPSDFTTRNGYLTCKAAYTRRGLDVSEHQGDIDWEAVREAGFDFAFIRIGYRGYTSGGIYADTCARDNLSEAKAAGLDVGVYFYAQAVNEIEAAEEARWCMDFLAGEKLDLPVVYDWEWVSNDARTGGMDKAALTECTKTFCDTIEEAGFDAMVYFNTHVATDLLDLEALQEYPWWLAQYKDHIDFPYRVDFWQYTETGTVPGIRGKVDIDLMFVYE